MNITDIDDKIIKRARQNFLFQAYVNKEHTFEEVFDDVRNVFQRLTESIKTTQDPDKHTMLNNLLNNVTGVVQELEKSIQEGNTREISNNIEVCEFSIINENTRHVRKSR